MSWFSKQKKIKHRLHPFFQKGSPVNFGKEAWRIFRIMTEFTEGFQFISPLKKCVCIYGSARFPEDDEHYLEAVALSKQLAAAGFSVVTGGGAGIMQAANLGAHGHGNRSIGMNIDLPAAQKTNPYVEKGMVFQYFFTRKLMLASSSQAYVFFPGGFGTLDEFFEIIALIQTKKMEKVPVILLGRDFWEPLLRFIDEILYQEHATIRKEDMSIYTLVDSPNAAFRIISASHDRKYF